MKFFVFCWRNPLFRKLFLLNILLYIPLVVPIDRAPVTTKKSEICHEAFWSKSLPGSGHHFSNLELTTVFFNESEDNGDGLFRQWHWIGPSPSYSKWAFPGETHHTGFHGRPLGRAPPTC